MQQHQRVESEEPWPEEFVRSLIEDRFEGEVSNAVTQRLVAGTDNSIYHLRPALVLYRRSGSDLNHVVRAGIADPAAPLLLTVRGRGAGTNGQLLTRGGAVDVSRRMNRILRLDVEAWVATVEPGVVLDQLNAALAPHGLFFPPTVSTASRATISGVAATDASGKGSRICGKTSAWIEAMDIVRPDGSDWAVRAMPLADADDLVERPGILGDVHRTVLGVTRDHAETIAQVFPTLNRSLTGYNLSDVRQPDGPIDLARLLSGSEGTLAITEFIGGDQEAINRALAKADALLSASPYRTMDWKPIRDAYTIRQLWSLREKSVRLLGCLGVRRQGHRLRRGNGRATEARRRFVEGFRAILDWHGLRHGTFGHADVGCPHVRPALYMAEPAERGEDPSRLGRGRGARQTLRKSPLGRARVRLPRRILAPRLPAHPIKALHDGLKVRHT